MIADKNIGLLFVISYWVLLLGEINGIAAKLNELGFVTGVVPNENFADCTVVAGVPNPLPNVVPV